jgi:hypothetical protein
VSIQLGEGSDPGERDEPSRDGADPYDGLVDASLLLKMKDET